MCDYLGGVGLSEFILAGGREGIREVGELGDILEQFSIERVDFQGLVVFLDELVPNFVFLGIAAESIFGLRALDLLQQPIRKIVKQNCL